MDDSCAVCADNLEWVAYGSCGHREVCSTCVVRLRFICGDRRCCICKTESPVVFVTKALGDYTRTINDFSTFPSEPKEGRVGPFWYHEDTQAFFDDLDQYRMIKAMCRLSCSVCDKMEDQPREGPRHRVRFKSVEQLKGHLYHRHKLHMCSLCLEGRKVFICEQKLYTRAQLNKHISTGDSEVDGSESERGGFAGHPMCEFCRNPFYGDNELYTHMSTEHYTCHICQRLHPGQYEYYRNYDDLEIHFRRDHFLCEDESCLAKKFIVFQSEAEFKRHNAIEHGGKMSRSQRSAALQIPTSFRYRRGSEQENRRGRGRSFRREPADNELSAAIQASMETARVESERSEPVPSSSAPGFSENAAIDDTDPLIQPFESLSTTDMEPSARYLQALGRSSGGIPLVESSFPPLSMQPSGSQSRSGQNLVNLPNNSMAARLKRQTNRNTTASSSPAWPAINRGPGQASGASGGSSASAWPAVGRGPASASTQFRPPTNVAQTITLASAISQDVNNGQMTVRGQSSSSAWNSGNASRISHSASAPNLSDTRLLESSDSDFPPVYAAQNRKSTTSIQAPNSQATPNVGDVQSANKSLVEKIRAGLGHDEDIYVAFKDISGQYRQGLIDTISYLEYVNGYGLSHLVLDLARLCPDPQKQKELIETHNASLRGEHLQENGWAAPCNSQPKNNRKSKKDKGKGVKVESSNNSGDALADNFMDRVRKLQSSYKPQDEDTEVLSKDKDSYRVARGKSKVTVDEQTLPKPRTPKDSSSSGGALSDGGGNTSKQRKKTSKFHRVRLGGGSMAALLDLNNLDPDPEPDPKDENSNGNENPAGGLPVRGVWQKGGGQKLFS